MLKYDIRIHLGTPVQRRRRRVTESELADELGWLHGLAISWQAPDVCYGIRPQKPHGQAKDSLNVASAIQPTTQSSSFAHS